MKKTQFLKIKLKSQKYLSILLQFAEKNEFDLKHLAQETDGTTRLILLERSSLVNFEDRKYNITLLSIFFNSIE